MKFNLRISFTDGRIIDPLVVALPDMLKFEEKFNIPVSSLAKDQRLSHIVFLGWASASRQKLTDKSFDDFAETVVEVTASDLDPK